MKQIWKRRAVVAGVLVLVAAAVYLNWRYSDSVEDSAKVLGESTLVSSREPVTNAEPVPAEPEKPTQTPSRPANSFLRSLDRTNLLITVGAAGALLALLVLVTVRTRSLAPALLVLLLLLLALLLGARRYGSLNPLDWFGLLSLRL